MFEPMSARLASSFSRNGISAGSHRDKLLRTDVHVLDFVAVLQHEVAGLTGVDQFGDDLAVVVELDVGLRDDVLVFFPRRQVVAVGFEFGRLLLAAARSSLAFSISPRVMTSDPP